MNWHKQQKGIKEGMSEGKIQTFTFLILTNNTLFKIIATSIPLSMHTHTHTHKEKNSNITLKIVIKSQMKRAKEE